MRFWKDGVRRAGGGEEEKARAAVISSLPLGH
jgi:hypothetical protein